MAKAILVMDKRPENCLDCHVGFYSGGVVICRGVDDGKPHETWFPEHIPEYCPLKELPEQEPYDPIEQEKLAKKEHLPVDWTQAFCIGWNACLNRIEGTED